MELITLGLGLIVNTCAKNKEVHAAIDDFVSDSVKWFRGWFGKGENVALMTKLEEEPESPEVKEQLSAAMGEMAKNEQFMKELERWVNESKKPNPTMKNVLEDIDIEVEGNINIGDEGGSDQKYDKKNYIKGGKLKVVKGDFNLGDRK
jgi:hypothetical protein